MGGRGGDELSKNKNFKRQTTIIAKQDKFCNKKLEAKQSRGSQICDLHE